MLDQAYHVIEMVRGFFGIVHRAERTIEYVVAAIGDVGLLIVSKTQRRFAAQLRESSGCHLPAERDDFHGNRD